MRKTKGKTKKTATAQRRRKRAPFHHLNQAKRDRMEALLKSGHAQKEVAAVIQVDPSTVCREKKKQKRKNGRYEAQAAERKAKVKRSNASYKGRKIEGKKELKEYVIAALKQKRSPDEIAGRMKRENMAFSVGKDAIYAWLRSAFGQQYCVYLCTKRYRKRKQKRTARREMIPNRIPLKHRPKRGEHAEGDLFVSPTRLHTSASGALVVIPSAQLLVGKMIENRKPDTMTQAVVGILSPLSIDDMTLDNGIENKKHEAWGIPTYFADPHAPWQKPHVENNIGLLRKWFVPKGTDLRLVSDELYQNYLHVLNGKYRKSLGYESAYEVAMRRGIIGEIPQMERGEVAREFIR